MPEPIPGQTPGGEQKLEVKEISQSQIKQKIDSANLDTEWVDKLDVNFKESKGDFEQDVVIFTMGVIDYLGKLDETGIDLQSEIVLFFPGRSGVGIERTIRTAVRDVFGSCPLSIRIPTESDIESGRTIEGEEISQRQVSAIEEWSRERISTPVLDRLLGRRFGHALIIDTDRVAGRTLKQVLFTTQPYSFENTSFIHPTVKSDTVRARTADREEVFGQNINNIKIPVNHLVNLDTTSKWVLFPWAGIKKAPSDRTDQEAIFESSAKMKELRQKMERLGDEFDQAENDKAIDALWTEYSKLCAEEENFRAEFRESGQKPPPLKFVRNRLAGQDKERIRQYAADLGHIAAEMIKEKDLQK